MITKIILEEKISAVFKLINSANNIVITAHKGPDGDAVGSSLGLYHFLYTLEKKATVILPDTPSESLNCLPSFDSILTHEKNAEEVKQIISECDLIFCLDFNKLDRLGTLAPLIEGVKCPKILVDHHLNYDNFADVIISHPEIASTSELVFRLICRMGYFSEMNLQTAECICAGMLTDTGGLAYNSNHPEIYTIISELLKKGVDKDALYRKLFNSYSESRMRLMGYFLCEKLTIIPEHQTAIFSLTKEELERFNFKKGDTEGFVNMPLSISGIRCSIFCREDSDTIKISMRSVGDYSVNDLANRTFGGGGHKNAAGAESTLTMKETIEKIVSELATPNS
jgi:phosphoesterase RecJ-like protein